MSDWVPPLAHMILDDRVDRGGSPTRALERAEHYRRWLETLPSAHDRLTCPEEAKIRLWPGSLCFHKGQATVVVGSQGKGKTNLLAFLIERAIRHRPEWEIYSNIPFPWDEELAGIVPPPPRLHSISTMSELLRGIAQTVRAGREPAVVIDEMDQVATSHEWMTERSESWTKFLFVERHLRVWGPILAYHVREHVPLPLRANAALRGSYLRVIVRHGKHQFVRAEDPTYFGGIWESVLPFLTLGLRGFEIDVDMRELQTVARGSHRRVAELTLQYLDDLDGRRKEEETTRRDVPRKSDLPSPEVAHALVEAEVIRRLESGATHRQIVEATGLSKYMVAGVSVRWRASRLRQQGPAPDSPGGARCPVPGSPP
jgi:hypothetical protein